MRYFLLLSLLSVVGCNAADQADLKKDATKLAEMEREFGGRDG